MAEIGDLVPIDDNNTGRWPEGMPPSNVNNAGRADEGIMSRWHRDTNGSLTSTGTSTAYQLTTNQNLTAYYDGLEITYQAHVACGASPTLQLGALGADNIVTGDDLELAADDIPAGSKVNVIYNGSKWVLMNVPNAGNLGLLSADNVWTGSNTFQSSDSGASEGPLVELFRDSGSPAASDLLGALPLTGNNSSSAKVTYAKIAAEITDATAGSEDGRLLLRTTTGGTEATALAVEKGIFTPNATGGDQGADSGNFGSLFVNGLAVPSNWTRYTRQSTTSGSSSSISGIDTAAQELIVDTNKIELSSSAAGLIFRVGTGTTPLTTGYSSAGSVSAGTTTSNINSTTEIVIRRINVSGDYHLTMRCILIDTSVNRWHFEYIAGKADANGTSYGHSTITLGAGNPLGVVELQPDTGSFVSGDWGVMSR